MEQGMVFTEYEQIPKRRPSGDCAIAQQPENGERNRFQDVLPYDDTRVELVPTKENNTGYINASHVKVGPGGSRWVREGAGGRGEESWTRVYVG